MNALTVADLTKEHVGWYMKIALKPQPDAIFQHFHRHIELGAIRRWEYPVGTPRTGLLDLSTKAPGITGTEYHDFAEDAEVTLVKQVRKPRKRKASR